jgi:hypothetical protein
MNPTVDKSGTLLSRAPLKAIATVSLLVGLSAIAFYAGLREHRSTVPQESVANPAFMADPQRPALSAEEEIYAAALWPIHSEVKLAAVRMTFAGLNYKTKDQDARNLETKVRPLIPVFESAAQRAGRLVPPATLAAAHASYLAAIADYAAASREMLKVVADGLDEHLVNAHGKSERAGVALLTLSDALWPGEYKPN